MNLRPQRTEREVYSLCDTSVAMRYQKVVGETQTQGEKYRIRQVQ